MRFTAAWLTLLVIVSDSGVTLSLASDPSYPSVVFDIPAAIACREIPTKTEKTQKLVEAEIPLSVSVGYPPEKFKSIRVAIETFEQLPKILDFMPKEKLVPATDGGVEITESEDARVSYGIINLLNVPIVAQADTKGRSLKKIYTLPARNVVQATSGTLKRGAGIWFKFERTEQHQLEKLHKLYIIFEVDQAWRCDAVHIEARGTTTGGEVCGEKVFYLGLYLEGDDEAKALASNLGLNTKHEGIVVSKGKVREIENYLAYPQLGYGSMAERERIKVRSLQKDFDDELFGLRQFRVK